MSKHANEAQIVKILEELRSGVNVDEICRTYNVGRSTLYKWRSKYGEISVSELKRLKSLEAENRKLKTMYADLSLRNEALKYIIDTKL